MYERLIAEMQKQGITGYRLGKMLHICRSDLYCAIKGTKPMYPGYKKRIADALGCTIEELFPEEGGNHNEE